MAMKNVQITLDDDTLEHVDRVGKPLGLNRSEIVRRALRQWLRHQAVESFERQWVAALQEQPDDPARADEWLESQAWGKK